LFAPTKLGYSSDISTNVNVTGVFINEDIRKEINKLKHNFMEPSKREIIQHAPDKPLMLKM